MSDERENTPAQAATPAPPPPSAADGELSEDTLESVSGGCFPSDFEPFGPPGGPPPYLPIREGL